MGLVASYCRLYNCIVLYMIDPTAFRANVVVAVAVVVGLGVVIEELVLVVVVVVVVVVELG